MQERCYADSHKNTSYMAKRAQLIKMTTIMSAFPENTMACYRDDPALMRIGLNTIGHHPLPKGKP